MQTDFKWFYVHLFVCAVLLAVALFGCTDDGYDVVDSPGVSTSSISAEIHVSYNGGEYVTVEVNLNEGPLGSNNDINLISGDTLKSSTVGDPSDLNFSDDLFDNLLEITNQVKTLKRGTRRVYDVVVSGIWYYATTDAKYRDKEFTVSLLRDNQSSAPNSVVSLPPDFTIGVVELTANNLLSRSGPITITWSPSNAGYSQNIKAFVHCDDGSNDEQTVTVDNVDPLNPVSSYEFPANTFSYTGNCQITFGMEHAGFGSTDLALNPTSFIQGHQYRSISVTTTP